MKDYSAVKKKGTTTAINNMDESQIHYAWIERSQTQKVTHCINPFTFDESTEITSADASGWRGVRF